LYSTVALQGANVIKKVGALSWDDAALAEAILIAKGGHSSQLKMFLNPFDYVEFELLILPGFLMASSVIVVLLDFIIKALIKDKRSWYLFMQIFALELVLGILFFLVF
jgi:hypothetical protein